ncbi:MAG TPA: TonB-dependent receptor [Geobacteraceae bacterium]|nr:TonB-dependent receptor [Geobacteraceae bacterium]
MANYFAFIMHSYHIKTSILFFCFSLVFLPFATTARAEVDEEMRVLQLFYQDNDLVVSSTRTEKAISQAAENIAIVTAEDIRTMNAHTVADVLNTVTGLHLANYASPWSASNIMIQGSATRHVTVLIDGVIQNNMSDSFPDVSAMRVQQIERIEIVKGPASSSWGSSLGGIINIITKSPEQSREVGGIVSASIGNRNSGDYRGEVSGTVGALGYYLAGGGLLSDGLQPHTMLQSGDIYGKFQWQAADATTFTLTLNYLNDSRGLGEFPLYDISFFNRNNRFFATLSAERQLTEELKLDLGFKALLTKSEIEMYLFNSDAELQKSWDEETTYGGSLRLTWSQQWHALVVGSDFDFGSVDSDIISNGSQYLDKWALYINDTLNFGPFSVTPGLRYDNTSTNGDFWSPSLGATWAVTDATIIRGYLARGFSIPPLGTTFATGFFSLPNPSLKMEKVWSYSAGLETAALKYVWLKTTYFRHEVSDALTSTALPGGYFIAVNGGKQRREGVELELKTMPVWNLSLTGGFCFINAKDKTTGETVPDVPRYSYDIGIQYNDSRFLRALLKGRYVDWNASPDGYAHDSAMIWDLNLSREIPLSDTVKAEVFFTAHNLFNGSQYTYNLYPNAKRWFEGGIRFAF